MTEAAQYTLTARSASELVREVEASVLSGGFEPGEALPSVRTLARQLGLSPATVAAGLAELRRRGVIITERRRGSRIGEGPPLGWRRGALPPPPPGTRDLSRGNPDPELLPDLRGALGRFALPERLYGEPQLHAGLAALARERLAADGIDATHLGILSGALDAIERVLQANLRAGDTVAVEDPGYAALYDLLRASGLQLAGVALDERGMLPGALEQALARGAGAVVITPRGQNPTGAALDGDRARELEAVLAAHPRALVIEDDHLGPIAGVPLRSLAGGRERWATTRSVAKSFGPDLRLALLAGDERTVARVLGRQGCGPGWVSHILQALVLELWSDADVQAGVEHAEARYSERRELLLRALRGRGIPAHGASGLNVWIPVAEEGAVLAGLLQRGFLVAPGAPYRLASSQPAIRVTISTLAGDEAERLAGEIAGVLAVDGSSRSG